MHFAFTYYFTKTDLKDFNLIFLVYVVILVTNLFFNYHI